MNDPSAAGSVVTVTFAPTARTCRPAGGGPFEARTVPSIVPVASCAPTATFSAATSSAAAHKRIVITPLMYQRCSRASKHRRATERRLSGRSIERVDEPAPRIGGALVGPVDLGAAPPAPDRAAATRPHGVNGQAAKLRNVDGR